MTPSNDKRQARPDTDEPTPVTPASPAAKASLSDRLASFKTSSGRLTGATRALKEQLGSGLTVVASRVRSARLPTATAATAETKVSDATELKRRVRAGLETLQREAAHGPAQTAIEHLEARSRDLPPPQPRQQSNTDATSPRHETFERSTSTTQRLAKSGAASATRAATVLIERTRTLGRVGLTAVHARLKARRDVEIRRATTPDSAPDATGSVTRLDAELPNVVALPPKPPRLASLWRDRRKSKQSPPTRSARLQPIERDTASATSRTQLARRETGRARIALGFGALLTAIVSGGLIHILTTFAIPALRTGSAYDRLRGVLPINQMKLVGSDQQPSPLPFLSADMRYAMCRYDLTQGPVAVSARLPEVGWSLTLYTPQGDNFYAVPAQEGRLTEAVFTIVPASDRMINITPGVRRADLDIAHVTSPQREGLIVIRAPLKGVTFQSSMLATLARATCQAIERR